ncbi:MAG TPA: hypothetical protein VG675_19440 [Bryobacteraceae bacterium]|nr:hypothetical protein [Bryobacteraceae bacterium]
MRHNQLKLLRAVLLALAAGTIAGAATKPEVSLLLDTSAGSPARIAMGKLRSALQEKRVSLEEIQRLEAARGETIIVAGLSKGSGAAAAYAKTLGLTLPSEPETVFIHRADWKGHKLILLSSGDNLGLAYALYDVVDRVGWTAAGTDPFSEVRDASEKPAVRDRAVSTYTMQQAYFESRLFNEAYWAKYFDNLVRNRFNNFYLLFGYESTGYLAPPYAWFFDLPEFPEVKAAGVTRQQQEHYLRALNRVIEMAHERGLYFTLGIWDHIYDGVSSYYTEGVWNHLPEVNGRRPRWPVEGLNEKNLVPYTQAALRHFLQVVPNLDGIQFRMHGESGLSKAGLRNFWEPIFRIMAQEHPKIRFDARAKEFPIDLINLALDMHVRLRLVTKYSAEQAGMPFHPTHLDRATQFGTRHGYADLLTYPQRYKMLWRLWTSGTMRVLLWGDPDYARRFAESSHLYDGDGFEVAEPLATKMASQPHDQAPFDLLKPQYRYYDQEFERYWAFFQAFGRLGYDPATNPEVWDKEFERHYGKLAGPPVERALHRASWILPKIVEYSLPASKFPTTRGWPERQRWEDLPGYAKANPIDTQVYASIQEEASNLLSGEETAKIRPEQTSQWFADTAKEVLADAAAAQPAAGAPRNKELDSTLVDLRILAHLAEYHSRRIYAGIHYSLFQQSHDVSELDAAIAWEQRAIQAWESLVESAGNIYADDMMLGLRETPATNRPGADLSGTWRDELPKLRSGLEKLQQEKTKFHLDCRQVVGRYDFGRGTLPAGYQRLPHRKDVSIVMPNGYYELAFTVRDDSAKPKDYGPMWIEANGEDHTDTFSVNAGASVERKLETAVRDGKLNLMFANPSEGSWTVSRMVVTRVEPRIAHVPVRVIHPGEDLVLKATVAADGDLQSVRAYFGDTAHGFTARDLEHVGTAQYRLTIPAAECTAGTHYFLEAVDSKGRRATYPHEGREQPVTVEMQSDTTPPSLTSTPVETARPEQPLRIVAQVQDPSGVRWVRLRYRSVNQYQDYRTLQMLPSGKAGQYQAEIPGEQIPARWDFQYFFEVMDNQGNGKIYPDADKETPYVVVKLDRSAK